MRTPTAVASVVSLLRSTLPSALALVGTMTIGAITLSGCGEPLPAESLDEPLALSQAPLALTKNSSGDWEWADRRVTSPNLQAIWGNSTSDVWAAGTGGGTLHWNGTSWRRIANPAMGETIWGLWGTGPNNVYAVGDNGLCMRWNGTTWRHIDLPIPSGVGLNDIWGSGPNDIWIVGDEGLVVRWNGTVWNTVRTTGDNSLFAVWGSGTNSVWMVGELGYMLKWDGTALSETSSGGTTLYTRLRGFSSNKAWLISDDGLVSPWDGTKWGAAGSGFCNSYSCSNLFVNNDTSIWFISSSRVYRWNGTMPIFFPNGGGNAIWTQGTTDGWSVGGSASLKRLVGTEFSSRW